MFFGTQCRTSFLSTRLCNPSYRTVCSERDMHIMPTDQPVGLAGDTLFHIASKPRRQFYEFVYRSRLVRPFGHSTTHSRSCAHSKPLSAKAMLPVIFFFTADYLCIISIGMFCYDYGRPIASLLLQRTPLYFGRFLLTYVRHTFRRGSYSNDILQTLPSIAYMLFWFSCGRQKSNLN